MKITTPERGDIIDFNARQAIICDHVNNFCLEEVIAKVKLIID